MSSYQIGKTDSSYALAIEEMYESYEMSQLMRLWHFSSSLNSFFKCAYAAIQWG